MLQECVLISCDAFGPPPHIVRCVYNTVVTRRVACRRHRCATLPHRGIFIYIGKSFVHHASVPSVQHQQQQRFVYNMCVRVYSRVRFLERPPHPPPCD